MLKNTYILVVIVLIAILFGTCKTPEKTIVKEESSVEVIEKLKSIKLLKQLLICLLLQILFLKYQLIWWVI